MNRVIAAGIAAAGIVVAPIYAMAAGNLASPPSTALELAITGANHQISADTFALETGHYYRLVITSDGGAEVLFTSPDLFNNVWLNQIVVAGAEIKLWGTGFKGVEVGEDGPNEVTITFVPVRPGDYTFFIEDENDVTEGTFHVE